MPAHHRRISAHDGDWRCRCRNPKRIKPLTLCSSKNLFKETPRKPAPAGPATGCPESGHCSPPEWARRRAEESWGVWLGLFFLSAQGLLCAVRCSIGMGNCVSIFLSLVFLHWPFAGQVTTQHECGFGGAAGRGLSRSRAETCASVYEYGGKDIPQRQHVPTITTFVWHHHEFTSISLVQV